ncbi:MAG: cell division protein ZapA [Betaproteobacteria bacterium]|jgi:cell division protein ZapA
MKQVEVTILGQSYLLACPEDGQEALLQAVATVDREMSAIRDAGKVKARERMAVLAALNLAYRLAEREMAAAQSPSPPPSPSPPGAAAQAPGAGSEWDGADGAGHVEELMRRLDKVLADDGRLL